MLTERPNFPFSAVAGQGAFKLALLLAAVNPAIGGVLISGPRGCAKSTLARAMADLLPAAPQGFVTLPLGASDDMLVGTLDLQQVLSEQKVAFHPGLLSRAHEGVLYVDEVNLLADGLVDVLLDVAASGVNRVERDGISHSHAAEFILVGTMNPDEGELRPQLQDRFGLAVELSNKYEVSERMDIVRVREAFDRNPIAFCAERAEQQADLIERLQQARERLEAVVCAEQWRVQIAERCFAAQVEGLRADIVWFRAAVTHAAWCGRDAVTQQDIDAVAELVLVHRRKAGADDTSGSGGKDSEGDDSGDQGSNGGGQSNNGTADDKPRQPDQSKSSSYRRPPQSQRPQQSQSQQALPPRQGQASEALQESGGDWGAMGQSQLQVAVCSDSLGVGFVEALEKCCAETRKADTRSRQVLTTNSSSTKRAGNQRSEQSTKGLGVSQKPNWFATLLASAGHWPPAELRFRQPQPSQGVLHMVLLDTSASGLTSSAGGAQMPGLLGTAKTAVLDIARGAYLKREQLSILGFGNQQLENILPRTRAPKLLRSQLDGVAAGGGTPLREAVLQAAGYLAGLLRQQPTLQLQTYLISDGRSTQSLSGITLPGKCVVIDTETAAVKRGRGEQFAQQLQAAYLPLAKL